jgi:hypothetical protein
MLRPKVGARKERKARENTSYISGQGGISGKEKTKCRKIKAAFFIANFHIAV